MKVVRKRRGVRRGERLPAEFDGKFRQNVQTVPEHLEFIVLTYTFSYKHFIQVNMETYTTLLWATNKA